jgi:DNA helicase II / ATP-dependent DNA helicase PcrA
MADTELHLDDAQRVAVEHPGPTLRILAGPGSGKTRVLTARISRRSADEIDARRVLALTFTRRAAAELRTRLRRSDIRDIGAVGTFHAVALQQLRIHRADLDRRPPIIVSSRAAVLRRLIEGRDSAELIRRADDAIGRGITPDRIRDERVGDLARRYQQHMRTNGMLDFDGVLDECTRLLRTDERFAAAQRWRFRHLFVDEFQDLNRRQFDLLTAWLGDGDDLCVVGDPDQAIYEWNGADARYLLDFERWFPGAHTVQLGTNHRSSGAIVTTAHAVLGQRTVTVRKPTGALPEISEHRDPHEEAQDLARRIRWRHGEGGRWSDHAVLARTNIQLDVVANALDRAGVPHRVRGRGGVSSQPEAEQAINFLTSAGTHFVACLVDLELNDVEQIDADLPVVASVLELARDYVEADMAPSGSGFGQWLRTLRPGDATPDADVVDLATFHAAKGLEWPHVTIAGAEEGLFPMNDTGEEVRLAYVAVTRAERSLHLSWCRVRDGERRRPTRWLREITAIGAPPVPPSSSQLAQHIATARAAAAEPEATQRRRRLIGWRSQVARARRILPEAVLRDDVVDAIVAAVPTSLDELAAATGLSALRLRRDAEAILAAVAGSSDATASRID